MLKVGGSALEDSWHPQFGLSVPNLCLAVDFDDQKVRTNIQWSKINILVLSFYFKPDLCAGSFRSTSLVKQLESMLIQGSQIDLVTTLPNRYKTFSQDARSWKTDWD